MDMLDVMMNMKDDIDEDWREKVNERVYQIAKHVVCTKPGIEGDRARAGQFWDESRQVDKRSDPTRLNAGGGLKHEGPTNPNQ